MDVLGDVDNDGTRTAGAGNVECLVQHPGQLVRAFDQVVVLGARARDADGVALLKGIGADQVGRNLAGDADHRDRIHQGVGQPGNGIGGAGARGDKDDADLAGCARVAFGGMHRTAFLADQDVAHLVLLEDLIVDRQHRSAGVAEDVFNTLVDQCLGDHFRAGHGACHDVSPQRRSLLQRSMNVARSF